MIKIYDAGGVSVSSLPAAPYPYFVMDFIEGVNDLEGALNTLLKGPKPTAELAGITHWVATQMRTVSEALHYLHKHETLHFDIKPGNILVDPAGKPIVSDLGFAKKKTAETKPIVVGFTSFYAHPDLRHAYEHMTSLNRVRAPRAPSQFKNVWDVYALGRTILQLLAMIEFKFSDAVMYDNTFVYVHLLACRMLDGHNLSKEDSKRLREEHPKEGGPPNVFLEHWLTLERTDLAGIKVHAVHEVCADLGKIEEQDSYLKNVPELSDHFPHRVQVATTAPAPFSERVKALVEHPVFLRLRTVKQLGITDTVYPGCTHTRLEHSLGAFRMCWLYLQALMHDPYNPLFRQLTSEDDLKCVLIASLLHDLGQYPLAHDLEEAAPRHLKELFRHERLTEAWLENSTKDAKGRTIKDIIENTESGWGVRIEVVKQLLKTKGTDERPTLVFDRPNLKMGLLQSIIDGPLDVDKLDYLVRDSKRAEIPYGAFIDVDRLVRNLTVVLIKDEKEKERTILTLGTYEKALSAAESVAFARYELYQTLYWHHTVRAVRPMLREVLRAISPRKPRAKVNFADAFEKFLGLKKIPRYVGIEELLLFLLDHAKDHGRELINMIRERRLYKRLLTIHQRHAGEEGKKTELERFRDAHKQDGFDESLQEEIRDRFEGYLVAKTGPKPSILDQDNTNRVIAELQQPGRIFADAPPARTGSHEKLRFAVEPKRQLQNYASRVEIGERVSEVWQQVFFKLMEIASKGRVYCHPDLRDELMTALGPDGIRDAVNAAVTKMIGA